ncbi:MAG: hypothetical protein ACLGSD_12405 [Acidobacteriota bacterium]
MRSKQWWLWLAVIVCAGTCSAKAAAGRGDLGANFNGEYQDIRYADLDNAGVRWIRGFIAMNRETAATVASSPGVADSLDVKARGFHVILTLKWELRKSGVPQHGTPEYEDTVATLNALLARVMGKVDILEIGNEPYWETPHDQRDTQLNPFYEAMARDVIAFRKAHCTAKCPTQLFMGALNQLNKPEVRQSAWVQRWLAFVKSTPQIRGVDIHPHVASFQDSLPFVQEVVKNIRPDQQFLVTEFSLVWYWKAHLDDRVPATFAERYGVARDMRMWEAIGSAIQHPYTQPEWDDLLEESPWFAAQKSYLKDEMKLFRNTKQLAVATYGFEQGGSMTRKFGPKSVPWLLNSVYARRTVRETPGAAAPTNPYWLEAFRELGNK